MGVHDWPASLPRPRPSLVTVSTTGAKYPSIAASSPSHSTVAGRRCPFTRAATSERERGHHLIQSDPITLP